MNVSALSRMFIANWLTVSTIQRSSVLAPSNYEKRISRVLGDVITPYHHKQAEKSGLERCHLEAALNIKPGHTLGIIDALLVHKMAGALLSLVDAGDTSEGEV